MSDKLYQLSLALQNIQDELIETGGDLTPDLEKHLDEINLAFNEKVENIGRWVRNLDGQMDMLDTEIVRLQTRKRGVKTLEKRLKDYVLVCMQQAGKVKMEYGLFNITVAKNPPSCEVVDEKNIPAKFLTVIPEHCTVDKKAVLDALKKGEEVNGAKLITDRINLRIK